MALFEIRGDDSETVLFDTDHSAEAIRWAGGYAKGWDFGGWERLEMWEKADPENPADTDTLTGTLEPGEGWKWNS